MLEQCKAYQLVLNHVPQAMTVINSLSEQISMIKKELEDLQLPVLHESGLLSKREIEVLDLVAKGFLNKEIAYQLTISDRTVQFHLKSIFEKLAVSSRTEAVTAALKSSLISL